MKLTDLPAAAFTTEPVHPPMRLVVDYDALAAVLDTKGWLVLRTDPSKDRANPNGSLETPMVKAFNSHIRVTRKRKLLTKRLAPDAWFVCLL